MPLTEQRKQKFNKLLRESRLRVLLRNGFYGNLLMHVKFVLDEEMPDMAAVGKNNKEEKTIFLNPDQIENLSEKELDLVLMHEIAHLALKHDQRRKELINKEIYDLACDIVVNSYLLNEYDNDEQFLILNGKVLRHKVPSGKEGSEYSAEEVYEMLNTDFNSDETGFEETNESDPSGDDLDNCNTSNDDYDSKEDEAEDNVESSNDDSESGEDDLEGDGNKDTENSGSKSGRSNGFDSHEKWDQSPIDLSDLDFNEVIDETCKAVQRWNPDNLYGIIPQQVYREFLELWEPKLDWRTLLNNFIQEEINDYSFTPPDRRFSDSDFFLPEFNDSEQQVKNILFMIDTSGSMSDEDITEAYFEIKGAIEQFNGKLEGWLGFFDAEVAGVKPFVDEEEFRMIKAEGGGGTSFICIFKYIEDNMQDYDINAIIILTDGYAPYPKKERAKGIPVLWIINNEESNPPWGKIARI